MTTEQRILKAAETEFLAKGYAGARTAAIAKAAGVTHAMLHYYFRSKENLFEQFLIRKIELFKDSFLIPFSENEDETVFEKLSAAITSHFNFLRSNPELPRFMINEVFQNMEKYENIYKYIQKMVGKVAANLQQSIDQAVLRGEAEQVDARKILVSMVFLNIFTLLASPLSGIIYGDSTDKVLDERLAENIELITRRIRKI